MNIKRVTLIGASLATVAVASYFISTTTSNNSAYYVAANGDDNRTSSQAQNPATPWKSISKVNSYFSSLAVGDSVLFKSGDTFYGNLVINKSGTSGNPIYIGSYGAGNATITGMTQIGSWSQYATNIYKANVSSIQLPLNILCVSDKPVAQGRWPNTGYKTIDSHNGYTSITDAELSGSNWTGGELCIKPQRWIIDRDKINSQSGNTLYYTATNNHQARDQWGYFIQNHLKTLDVENEWYCSSSKDVYIYANQAPQNVSVATLKTILTCSSKNYITFENLNFEGANENIANISGSDINTYNCNFLNAGQTGIAFNVTRLKVKWVDVSNTLDKAITSGGTNCDLSYLNVKNTGYIAGAGGTGDGHYFGITVTSNTKLSYVRLDSAGYVGIIFNGDNIEVMNNYITNWCFLKDDAGAIYTRPSSNDLVQSGNKIEGNICINSNGAKEGVNNVNGSSDGIYFDDRSNHCTCKNNFIVHAGIRGIFVHNANNIDISGNTVYDCQLGQLAISHDGLFPTALIRNLNVQNNNFYAANSTQLCNLIYTYPSTTDDTKSFGVFDYNKYSKPSYPSRLNKVAPYSKAGAYYDLATWKSHYGLDAHATSPVTKAGQVSYKINFSDTIKNEDLGTNKYLLSDGNIVSGVIPIPAHSGILLTLQ